MFSHQANFGRHAKEAHKQIRLKPKLQLVKQGNQQIQTGASLSSPFKSVGSPSARNSGGASGAGSDATSILDKKPIGSPSLSPHKRPGPKTEVYPRLTARSEFINSLDVSTWHHYIEQLPEGRVACKKCGAGLCQNFRF